MDCLMKTCHGGVMSLQEYLHRILPELINQELTVNPRKGFQLFLSKTVVGLHSNSSLQKSTVLCARSETDEQTQVVQEVVQELLKSGRSNVLTLGLPRSLPCDAGLSFHSDHNYPQMITPHWSKLLQIIGKTFMKDLLLNTSIFTEVALSCYIQLSGVPVHTILSDKLHSQPKSSVYGKEKVTSQVTNQLIPSVTLDKAISAVTMCYDKGFHRKLHKSHPLNSLPASNIGANHMTYLIFQKEKFEKGRIMKKKMKRIPPRLRRSKDLLKQLLINFKKTQLQVFHPRPVAGVNVMCHETEDQAENHQHVFVPPGSSSGPSTELTCIRDSTMISKESISHLHKRDSLSNEMYPTKVAIEADARIHEKDDECGMEYIENGLKESGKSETCQMLGGEIFTDTQFEKRTKVNHIDVMAGQSISVVEPISETGNASALKKNMLQDILKGTSYAGEQDCFVRETESINGSKDAKENSFEKLVTYDCSGSISSVLDGSTELFSSPESVGKVREGLASHEMGLIAASCTDSSAETGRKFDKNAECEFVRKHVSMATTDENIHDQYFSKCFVNFAKGRNLQQSSGTTDENMQDENIQAQHFQKCFVNFAKGRKSQQSSGTSTDLDSYGGEEKEEIREKKRKSLHLLDKNEKEVNKSSDCQNVEVCVRESPLQQDLGNCGKDAWTSSSSENVLNSGKAGGDGTHFEGEITGEKMSKTEVVNLVEGDNEHFFDAQEKLESAVNLTIPGIESIPKTAEADTILEQNMQPVLDRNPQTTMTTRVFADILDSCDDVIMNEDEFVNEECQTKLESMDVVQPLGSNQQQMMTAVVADTLDSCEDVIMNEDEFVEEDCQTKLKSCLDKSGNIDVYKTVILEGNPLESCDDVEMNEETFLCEKRSADEGSEVKEPSNECITLNEVMHSKQSMEEGSLPLKGGSLSEERRATIRNLRMQLKQKLRQKNIRRKNSVLKNIHSGKNRLRRQREQNWHYHGNRRDIIKASRKKYRNVTKSDDRCPQNLSRVSRNDEKDNMQGQDIVEKSNSLLREPSCHLENSTVRCFSCIQRKSSDLSMQINSTDVNILGTGEEVDSLASNLHIHEHSGKTGERVHDRKCLCHKSYASTNKVKWTVSRSKQRSIKWCHHSNSNLKSLHRKTQRLQKGQITGRKSRNILSIQFSQDSPLAKGLSGGEVYVSVRGLLKEIIPEQLWGSTANKNAFFKYLKLLLKLGRFEKLPLCLMTKSLKYSDCEWTRGTKEDWKRRPKTDRIKRKELMERLFEWLMLYYVTETSVSKNELVYYPKEMWKQMQEKAISDYKNSGYVTPVDEDNMKLMIMSQKTLGRSKVRFIPKETGFRPIVKMGKTTLPDKQKFGINLLLRDLQDVLTHLRRVHPQLFASSLLGITSIYPKWKEFVEKKREDRESRPLYFVKVDISKCYDSIPHNKLLEVVAAHLKQQNLARKYLVRRYTVTSVSGLGDIRKKAMRHVTPVEGEQDFGHSFHQILRDLIKDGSHHKSVITNQASFHLETVDSLLNRLRQLINYDIVSIGNLDFLRTKGISQGSVLSSLLCSIFYGNMENRYLTGVDKDGLLMRLIDDFLLVTPYLHCATKFMQVLLSGECSETFGCKVNPQKTLTNFEFIYEGQPVQQLQGDWFPWCGFLFNVKTLEVKNDYQRYAATSFRYSMTLSFSSSDTLKMMKLKLIQALHRSKGLVIFIDPSINSQRVITENIYHLFLLTAFRFHSYYQALPQLLKRTNTTKDLLGIIMDIAPSFYFKAKKTLQKLPAEDEFPLSLTAMKWLCIKAFDVKLSRHFGVYRKLILVLRQQRRKLARKLDSSTRHALSQGSTPDIPIVFKKTRT